MDDLYDLIMDMIIFYPYVLMCLFGYKIVNSAYLTPEFVLSFLVVVLCISAILLNLMNIKLVKSYNGVFKDV